jgi:ribonuclease HII
MKILGIDEAGRGCVIGPLVVAGVLVAEERVEELGRLGVRDSKKLSRARRDALLPQIETVAQRLFCVEIAPDALTENLTDVELGAFAQIIRESKAEHVILDLPVGPASRDRFIHALLEKTGESQWHSLVAENGADARYAVVSAASIVAKVRRDRAIARLREQYGDFGWGYPSEKKTRAFLKEYFTRTGRFPECARAKWRTVQEISALKLDV